jgi:hypothetical protein
MVDDDTADLTPRAGGARSRGGRSRRTAAARASAAARTAAAAAAAGTAAAVAAAAGGFGGSCRPGIPGKVCCECGATTTPQWREGPKGEGAWLPWLLLLLLLLLLPVCLCWASFQKHALLPPAVSQSHRRLVCTRIGWWVSVPAQAGG